MLDAFLGGEAVEAAPLLLGRTVVSVIGGERTAVLITEVEAYGAGDDPASHAYRGRTERNKAMFGPPGTVYVYLSYGVHWCMNVVCRPEGVAAAVLLRGGIPVQGREMMIERRGRESNIANGPGNLCQALGVTGETDGTGLLHGPITISEERVEGAITTSARIGISKARERRWRFVLNDVSGDWPGNRTRVGTESGV